jgi:hypothetical protein
VALLMPGTGKLAGWSDLSISPLNYPAYNNVMGMFAVMETPELRFYHSQAKRFGLRFIDYSVNYDGHRV